MLASVAQPSPFVAKLDPQGEALWVDRYPVTAGSTAETYALVPMPSGVILGLAGNANNTTLDIDYGDGNGPQQGHTQLFALPAN
jgi:hypothetical protein